MPKCKESLMAVDVQYEYDVAFSFLAEDEDLAVRISDALLDRMKVFIYSERQKELVGKDGVEQFSTLFGEKARVCVVLYREGWGQTKWTRIEETAIKDRAFDKGWDFLIIIALDSSKIPAWLPKTKIWLGFDRFGLEGAASVIDSRVQETGGEVTEESPLEKADRLLRMTKLKNKHQKILESAEGVKMARQELRILFSNIGNEVKAIRSLSESPELSFSLRNETLCAVDTPYGSFTMGWSQQYSNSLKYASLFIQEFRVPYSLSHGGDMENTDGAELLGNVRIYFVLDDAGLPAWCEKDAPERFYSSKELGNRYLKRLIDHVYGHPTIHPRGW